MIDAIRKILKVFADANLFNEGVELIGSWCFKFYQAHLGAKEFPLMTQDIDFLIPNPYRGKEHLDFINQLKGLGFNLDFKQNGAIYLWNAELKIEFITVEKGRGVDHAIKIKNLGLNAIPLRFVSLLLDKSITVIDSGIKIRLPHPANFCLHKLVIAARRRKPDKSLKDLQQAVCTSVIVDKKEIRDLFDSLPPKWRRAILKMLNKAEREIPLLSKEIKNLDFTLQN
ncbi:MAG: GSU2403 family nucleotidyltransferase fold protein, partial [Planctomycetota bacterium]